ncbi:MAG: hypothetical protein F4186_11615 [Boseongicola sp. SB0676_bin_33]|nr:hypothetical protein [Boseongicola sp. SB0676_bin_33]
MDGQLQIRYETKLSAEEYVSTEAWCDAGLESCPNHPDGGCSFGSHGTYARRTPAGARVPRWHCRDSNTTFSKLADCLAARTPGTLAAFEAAPGVQEAARQARPGHHISDRAAERRWVRWRAECVHRLLAIVIGLPPELLQGVAPEIAAFRARLGTDSVLTQPPPGPGHDLIVSTAGVCTAVRQWLEAFGLTRIGCGFDARNQAADALAHRDTRVWRLRPEGGAKNWNDRIRKPEARPEPA